ncbi:hypothetical protein BLL52_1448 [Rhodoferax antarcticus ANT.BR]|uniref:Uncharacterized protein n=1 Tax=Rhodoferax antarcticus ANT.BR TaxID=1111071 RepID=A0A1Q8YGH3_9BURK|nr:hypothetical protein BLL52_1448 [Rhodoferax antarcticus ANT.BR]
MSPACFNPRPPLLAGELPAIAISEGRYLVSIRARHCWRANFGAMAHHWRKGVFQSAPAIAGGRTSSRHHRTGQHRVSIRARHCWRAN